MPSIPKLIFGILGIEYLTKLIVETVLGVATFKNFIHIKYYTVYKRYFRLRQDFEASNDL